MNRPIVRICVLSPQSLSYPRLCCSIEVIDIIIIESRREGSGEIFCYEKAAHLHSV